jgi:K+/H+ antiporter YhaU regulatory subunit KhtT
LPPTGAVSILSRESDLSAGHYTSGAALARLAKKQGEEALAVDPYLKVLKVPAPAAFTGRHPSDLNIRARTGCTVVAVERDEEVLVEFNPDFRFTPDDTVYVCGSSAAVRRFTEVFRVG